MDCYARNGAGAYQRTSKTQAAAPIAAHSVSVTLSEGPSISPNTRSKVAAK